MKKEISCLRERKRLGQIVRGNSRFNDWKVGSESKVAEMVGFVYFIFSSFLTGFNGAGRVGSARAVA